jgi:Zn finger protein HypA/HybF involved in hydrogenase expression
MDRYYENKRLRSGAPRRCKECSATLSKYNLGKVCSACEAKTVEDGKTLLMNQIAVIVWE